METPKDLRAALETAAEWKRHCLSLRANNLPEPAGGFVAAAEARLAEGRRVAAERVADGSLPAAVAARAIEKLEARLAGAKAAAEELEKEARR